MTKLQRTAFESSRAGEYFDARQLSAPCGAYEVAWDDAEEAGEGGPEFCGACGRQTATAIVWADLEEPETDGIPSGTPSGTPGGGR